MTVSATKDALRRSTRAAVAKLTAADRAQAGTELVRQISSHPVWLDARYVMLFSPLPDEPPIADLLSLGIVDGKTMCLPRSRPEADTYEAAIVGDVAKDLVPARFGILEPSANCPALPLNQLDLVFVPGVAFAPCGARLGRGRGFYDRILAAVAGARIGIGFDAQLASKIPVEPHDMRLTGLVTPGRGWRTFPDGAE